MSGELYELALSVPWCCTGEALEAMLSIAARDPLPADEIARRMHGPKSLALRKGEQRDDSRRMTMHGPVAVIPIDGPIYRYADFFTSMSGGVTTESLARDLQTALDDPAVGGILFAIDSPGGEATGINELSDAIYAARGRKPIVAHIEGYGASAAYWIASAADLITVDDSALVGSIGTILGVPDPTKRPSYRIDIVSTQSPKKKPDVMTESGRAILQQLADDMTEVFITKVARNRQITREQILAIEGGMLIGQQAIAAGLADRLDSEASAISALGRGDIRALPPARRPTSPLLGGQSAAKEMNLMAVDQKGFWAGFFGGAKEAGVITEASEQTARIESAAAPLQPVQGKAEDDDRAAKVAAENAELRKQLAAAKAERIQAEAQAFAKEQIGLGHAYPVEAPQLAALYAQAAEDDQAAPLDNGRSRTALLRTAVEARPKSQMARNLIEGVAQKGGLALSNNAGGEQDELAQVRANTEAYAKQRNGKK